MSKEEPKGKVLVCKPGSYDPSKHGRLFDALHALLLRRARNNALKGLIAHMRHKYGSKLVPVLISDHRRRRLGNKHGKEKWKDSLARMTS